VHDINWAVLATCVIGSIAAGLVIYHVVAGYYHVRYYRRRRDEPEAWKCQPKRFLRPELHRDAVVRGSIMLTIAGFISGVLVYAIWAGMPTPIYFDVSEYGWGYTIGSTIGLFIVMDALAYYVHRAMHIKFMFKHVHRYHHKFIATSPYVSLALHPVEMLSLQAVTLAPVFILPFHAASIGVVLVYILVFNIIDHSGVKLTSSLPWQGPSMYHDDHHAHFHVNFGQHLMFWDRIHGTLRLPGRKYGKHVFGGRGVASDERQAATDGFRGY